MAAKIHQCLQPSTNGMFFSPTVVLVEGLEDAAYLAAYLNLLEKWEEFRRIGIQQTGSVNCTQPIPTRLIASPAGADCPRYA